MTAPAGHSVFTITGLSVVSFGSGVTSDVTAASTANALTAASGEVFKNGNKPWIVSGLPLHPLEFSQHLRYPFPYYLAALPLRLYEICLFCTQFGAVSPSPSNAPPRITQWTVTPVLLFSGGQGRPHAGSSVQHGHGGQRLGRRQ